MRPFRSALLLLLSLTSFHHLCAASEIDERQAIADEVKQLFAQERFADLSKLADRYRIGKSRTSSGVWKITWFYMGINQALHSDMPRNGIEPAARVMDDKMKRWLALQPHSSTAHLVYAAMLMRHAWAIRGGGYASSVKADAWDGFAEWVEKSRVYLEAYKAEAAVDPDWYEQMLDIGTYQSWDAKKYGATFEAAIAQAPAFYPIYFSALDYFLPKWKGNARDVESFVQYATTKSAATEGTGMYARIYWDASQVQYEDGLFEESLASWPKMKKSFDDILARYPDDWNYQNYGRFACLAHDKKATAAFFAKVGDRMLPEAWKAPGLFDQCKAWAQSGAI